MGAVACKTRTTEVGGKRDAGATTQQTEAESQEDVDMKPSVGTFPPNGSIAAGQVIRTTGNSISGRTQTGTSTAIPRSASWLKSVGAAFTQLYDIHSDNFAVGSVGATGAFSYVIHLNSTLGYVNPSTMMLMYCEPQMVSQSSDAVAVLDCMDAMPVSKISKTAKYGNGNAVFDATGALLYEDGTKIVHSGEVWKTINGRLVFQGATFYYGNGNVMRSSDGVANFSNGVKAFDPALKSLFFDDATVFSSNAGATSFYRGGRKLSVMGPGSVEFYYPSTFAIDRPVLTASISINAPGDRTSTMNHPNGNAALSQNKVYRDNGSEAPVEVYGVEETPQSAVIWSASPIYTNLSISQYIKEATFNVLDEYVAPNSLLPGTPQNPTNLQITATTHQSFVAQWASGGGTTAHPVSTAAMV